MVAEGHMVTIDREQGLDNGLPAVVEHVKYHVATAAVSTVDSRMTERALVSKVVGLLGEQ